MVESGYDGHQWGLAPRCGQLHGNVNVFFGFA